MIQENHVLMGPFVVLLAINIIIPFLENVRSEGLDILAEAKDGTYDAKLSKIYFIIGSVVNLIVGIYCFLVSLGAWMSIKDY